MQLMMLVWQLVAMADPVLPSVIIMPLEAKTGVNKELAEIVTQLLADEASKLGTHRVVTYREVEGTMSAEQLRQVSGCTATSCAAEIAGALNADELAMGQL